MHQHLDIPLSDIQVLTQTNETAAGTDSLMSEEEAQFLRNVLGFGVAVPCNLFTMVLMLILIYELITYYRSAKKNRAIERKPMYRNAAIYVSSILVLSILNQICIFVSYSVALFDMLMEFYLAFAMMFYFRYYRECINVYINDQFIAALKEGQTEKFKDLFDKFNSQLKRRPESEKFVEELAQNSITKLQDNNPEVEEEIRAEVLKLVQYKGKALHLCCCKNFCSISIPEGNYNFAVTLNIVIRSICNICFLVEVIFTLIDYLLTQQAIEDGKTPTGSEVLNFNYLDIIQIALTCVVIYTIILFDQLIRKVKRRDDPFNNGIIYSFVIFMVILQKYLVELVFRDYLHETSTLMVVTVIRQTLMAIELLFIQIPFRHNFSLNYIEG